MIMKKIRLLSVLVILILTLIAAGCGGGGGARSVEIDKDVVGITSTLNNFIAAARSGDQAALQSLLASPGEYYLFVKDFGKDINDPNDNATYTFYVDQELINQPSSDLAHVYAYYIQYSGEPLWLYFRMVREDGRWVIEQMLNEAPKSGGYVQPVGPVSPEIPSQFIIASYNPMDSNIDKIYAIEDNAGRASATRLITSYTEPWLDSDTGIMFAELIEMYEEPDGASYQGFVPSGLIPNQSSVRNSLPRAISRAVASNLRSSRFSLRGQLEDPYLSVYYGFDSSGAMWLKLIDSSSTVIFNDNKPIKLFEPSHPYGTTRTITYLTDIDGMVFSSTITISIGFPTSFTTPLKTYTAVPVTFTDVDDETGEGSKWIEYLVPAVGEVGYDDYETVTSTAPIERDLLLTRFNGDGSLNERNDPIITNTDTDLGSYAYGESILSKQVTVTGGTAPLVIQWYDAGLGPEMLLEGIGISPIGVISGYIAGTPALGTYSSRVMVKDKYGRYSAKYFTITVEDGGVTGAAVSFSPSVAAELPISTSYEYTVLVNGVSVPYNSYTFSISPDPSTFSSTASVGVYPTTSRDDTSPAMLSIYGFDPGMITFTVTATSVANEFSSDPITISFGSLAVNKR